MCRLLCVKSEKPFPIADFLQPFAEMSRKSKEYQGDGWGYAIHDRSGWRLYHCVDPIWEDDLSVKVNTTMLIAHARSAFGGSPVAVEYNMPYTDGRSVFVFNGELRGVRIQSEGRIGAEKIFSLIRSYDKGDTRSALELAMTVLEKRSTYIKAANIIMSDGPSILAASRFNEDDEYYTLWKSTDNETMVIASEPIDNNKTWQPIPQGVHRIA